MHAQKDRFKNWRHVANKRVQESEGQSCMANSQRSAKLALYIHFHIMLQRQPRPQDSWPILVAQGDVYLCNVYILQFLKYSMRCLCCEVPFPPEWDLRRWPKWNTGRPPCWDLRANYFVTRIHCQRTRPAKYFTRSWEAHQFNTGLSNIKKSIPKKFDANFAKQVWQQ